MVGCAGRYVINQFIRVLFPVSGGSFAGFLLQCFFVISIGQLTKAIVTEKERRIREGAWIGFGFALALITGYQISIITLEIS